MDWPGSNSWPGTPPCFSTCPKRVKRVATPTSNIASRIFRSSPSVRDRRAGSLSALGFGGEAADPAGGVGTGFCWRVTEAAKILGLEPYLNRKPSALSGGQRQRVAMGRAIVREPQAFLMDEPLSNLDAKLRVSMRGSLNQLHERLGVTTVYVTHDQVEAMTLGHRVCVLRDGRLQQVDTPQYLFEAPVNLFVAGFIGSPAMNFVTADLIRDGGPAVTFAGYKLAVPSAVIDAKQEIGRAHV